MYTEKNDFESLIQYVIKKHKPTEVISGPEDDIEPQSDSTHLIYEIGGDSKTKILTRVGEARPNGKNGDFTMCIYNKFTVSGELALVKKAI